MKILELHTSTIKLKKTKKTEFNERINNIIFMLEFHTRITHENLEILHRNLEHYENHIIPHENHENTENPRILIENQTKK